MNDRNNIDWHRALNGEPRFDDVLADPIVVRLMDRDGVTREDLRHLRVVQRASMDQARA